MYDFMIKLAGICKDIAIPILGVFILLAVIQYLMSKSNLYNSITALIQSSTEYINAETKKSNNNIKEFNSQREKK